MCDDYDVPFLGALPLDIRIREQADSGRPTVVADPDGAIAADLPGDRAQGRGVRRAEGRGLLREVPEHRRAEHVIAGATARPAMIKSDSGSAAWRPSTG